MGLLGLLSRLDYGMGGRLGKVIYLDSQNTVKCVYYGSCRNIKDERRNGTNCPRTP